LVKTAACEKEKRQEQKLVVCPEVHHGCQLEERQLLPKNEKITKKY